MVVAFSTVFGIETDQDFRWFSNWRIKFDFIVFVRPWFNIDRSQIFVGVPVSNSKGYSDLG